MRGLLASSRLLVHSALAAWATLLLGLSGCSAESPRTADARIRTDLVARVQNGVDRIIQPEHQISRKSVASGVDEPGNAVYYRQGDTRAVVVQIPVSNRTVEWTFYWHRDVLLLCRDRGIANREGGKTVAAVGEPTERNYYFDKGAVAYFTCTWYPLSALQMDEASILNLAAFFRKGETAAEIDATQVIPQ